MLKPDGRVVMISGANRGIGASIATTLASLGYKLSLAARNPEEIDTSQLPDHVLTHSWDATNSTDSEKWANATIAHYGRIDAVVLNAGIVTRVGVETGSEDDLDAMWDVNFKGPLRLVRATLPALRNGQHGRIVNIVSLAGKRLLAEHNLGYSASKFAALALTHAIRRNGWEDGIRATAICPGLVDTDMVANVKAPDNAFKITPDTIAHTAAYALSLPDNAVVAEILVNSRLEPSF